ncbi:MAG: TetR/AcrR family transcriptional regulator [Jatrophihabitans sp.]
MVGRHPAREQVHRSQAERVEATRARLLDATIELLAERGYSRTSTNDIVRRAHVSRGALAHHFRTKNQLVSAAAQRLVDNRAVEFRERFSAIAPERRTAAEALRVLWSFYDDPGCVAILELTIAARHEPELHDVLAPVPEQIAELTASVVLEFLPELAGLPFLDESLRAIHALFAGLALGALACHSPANHSPANHSAANHSAANLSADSHGAEVRAFVTLLATIVPQFPVLTDRVRGSQ